MNKEFSNSEFVIESLHRARMEQWIGDFEEAEKIYDAILASDNNIAIYLKPSIEVKKKKLIADKVFYQKRKDFFDSFEIDHYGEQLLFDSPVPKAKFGAQKYISPLIQKKEININNPVELVWKYSAK